MSWTRRLPLLIGGFIVTFAVLIAIFGPMLAPHDPFTQDLGHRFIPPAWLPGGSSAHPFGTDQLGRDYLSRLLLGIRIRRGGGGLLGRVGLVSGVRLWFGRVRPLRSGIGLWPVQGRLLRGGILRLGGI